MSDLFIEVKLDYHYRFLTRYDSSGLSKTPKHQLSDSDMYPSTFHSTPERREFSKASWEKFTRDSTQKAVKELVASPDFSQWVAANAERITVTPNSTSTSSQPLPRRKWLLW